MKKIILASNSPRRRELLAGMNVEFEAVSPKFDERSFTLEAKPESVEKLSLLKAKSISVDLKVSALVIGADTIVVKSNEIMGKPKDEQDAFRMLRSLSGCRHEVITGVAVVDTESSAEKTSHAVTYVNFNELTDEDIWNYIKDKKPFDKAGSYGIQELPENFVKSIDGYYDNVVGLPTKILINLLNTIKNQ